MALKLYDEDNVSAIAQAIRSKNGLADTYKIAEMASAVDSLQEDLLFLLEQNSSNNRLTLTDEAIKSRATKIRKYTFYEGYIGSINLARITEVEAYAFYNGRASNIILPNCITLGNHAFYKINNTDDNITNYDLSSVETVGSQCFYESHLAGLLNLPKCKSIGSNAFRSSRITGVSLPLCESIDTEAFNFVSFATDISLPKIKTIGARAFNHAHSVNFTIGAECTSIGSNIFNAGSGVTNLYVLATTPPTLAGRFKGTSGAQGVSNIYVPAESVEAYQQATMWSNYASVIQAIQE